MSVFTVDLQNQPGELARLCEAMADDWAAGVAAFRSGRAIIHVA